MSIYNFIETKIVGIIDFYDSIIKSKKIRLTLWLVFSALSVISIFFLAFTPFYWIPVITLTICLFALIITAFLTSKFYSWPFLSFFLVFIGIIFKRNHFANAAILMTLGTVFLGILSLYNAGKISINFRNNTFLKWFGYLTGIIVTLFMFGILNMNLYWNGNIRAILIYSGCFLFLITVLAMVFTLPFSNYVAWMDLERKVFFRTIIIPMLFIFVFFALVFIFPDAYNYLLGRRATPSAPWINFVPFYLNAEGI